MDLYLCSTPYHIYLSLLLIHKNNKRSILYLTSNDATITEFFYQIQANSKMSDRLAEVFVKEPRKSKLDFNRREEQVEQKVFKDLHQRYKELTLYLFPWNPHTLYTISQFWFKNSSRTILVEDGANVYDFPKPKLWKQLIKHYFLGYQSDFYNHDSVKEILVQFPEKYTSMPPRKLRRLDLRYLEESMTDAQREQILATFGYKADSKVSQLQGATLLLTQPLSEDGYISEEEKIAKYRRIVENESLKGQVVIKKHPRDKTIYDFENVKELEKWFPSELFNLLGIKFRRAISICSSSIDNIIADEKLQTEPSLLKGKKS